ncbi:heparinase II/III family protein [Bacteroides caecigallinarum]|uniref:heparinase II/III domain-containing protein n=1 Tax=Bacteroides caecigallinarum TaxID=1411144 RepID=UPI001957F76F|nr:heparinase II/III family protein [Bacteroides caecigallinarum]MBM6960929.1 heparinase II/III family protein [Bacteroides caecigallinarum]
MKKQFLSLVFSLIVCLISSAKTVTNETLNTDHPRYLTTEKEKKETLDLIKKEKWAKDVFDGLTSRVEKYSSKGPEWLTSRLQMYWKSHATDVYIRGEYYDHAGGEKAPAPTVMYTGARSHATIYRRPKLEDITPYHEDTKGMYLANTSLNGEPLEWVSISKTGRMIESINSEIMGIARDAAFLWWLTGKEEYASMAASVFDTYMTGIYYRNVPIDLNNGHQQTLVGMSSFEVIHEDIIKSLVPLYDFLYKYLREKKPEKMDIYASAFKKWADNIIANGVPHNNWNLMQARFVMDIALILENNALYADGKGREYYIDYIINQSSIRQWSLKRLAEYGYDSNTGIWAECPGYSSVVVGDYAQFVNLFDRNLGYDLTKDIPVISKAVSAMPQYLFPNMMQVGFGDTHPSYLRTDIFKYMIANAQQHGKKDEEEHFTRMLKLFDPNAEKVSAGQGKMPIAVTSFFSDKPLKINPKTEAGKIDDYVTPSFYAPNVSWLVQRNGMDKENSLMISLNGSDGNHMHANGIGMELYGKGLPLAPDAGIGTMGYSGLDYLEYYSQFPSHNTVCVDGISSYPVMKSNHAFKVRNLYPESGVKVPYQPVSYSEVYFREPESYSDQTRLNGIVNTSDSTGYYVDIFRSRKVEGGDKMHDYFYHNMGQVMTLKAADGTDLNLQPTQELAFAGAHLYAYSYIYDKKSAQTDKNIKAEYTINMPDKNDITMNMWMKGEKDREVFSALSPMTEGISRIRGMPYDIKKQPTLTFVARQKGEAWTRPFVSIFEPVTKSSPSAISSVEYPLVISDGQSNSNIAVVVNLKDGRKDLILSSDTNAYLCKSENVETKSTYSVCRSKEGMPVLIFLGNGTCYKCKGIEIKSTTPSDILVYYEHQKWKCKSSSDAVIIIEGTRYEISAGKDEIILK